MHRTCFVKCDACPWAEGKAFPASSWKITCKSLFNINYSTLSGPGSVVGIATGYGLDGPGIESQWGWDFPHLSRPVLGPTQPPVQWVPGLFRGGKEWPGRDADPSPPYSAVGHERVVVYLYSPCGPYGLYRASVPEQGCTLPFFLQYFELKCVDPDSRKFGITVHSAAWNQRRASEGSSCYGRVKPSTLFVIKLLLSSLADVAGAVLNRIDSAFPRNVNRNLLSHKALITQKAVIWSCLFSQWIRLLTLSWLPLYFLFSFQIMMMMINVVIIIIIDKDNRPAEDFDPSTAVSAVRWAVILSILQVTVWDLKFWQPCRLVFRY